jgi:acyl transferase domain-containing protein/acyl carrier protein
MLDVLNRYAHGFVVVAVTLACRRRRVFEALQRSPQTAEELTGALSANSGHLAVALRMFESLGWLDRDADKRYRTTPALAQQQLIPDDVWRLFEADMDAYLRRGDGTLLRPWLARMKQRWGVDDALIADYLDSLLVVPVLAQLTKREILREQPARDFRDLPNGVRDEVIELLEFLGWLEGAAGARRLTPPGEFMFDRAMNLGVAESYRTMLAALDDLLFGDAAAVFALRPDGHENHVDRTMNVLASGHMHDRYFAEVEEILVAIFSREPFSSQPRYVADMGSGDGTFLKRVYETVRDKTPRGRALDRYPLTMIGIDLNRASLDATSRTLHDIDHVVVTGDIGNPQGVADSLRQLGVDPGAVLHIRSFLDHDRPYIPPSDRATLEARLAADYRGVYVDRRGQAISPAAAVQSLVEHLSRWAGIVNEHGFILLEVHCQEPLVVREFLDQSESLYFDAIEAFSHQLLIEADAALLAAAEAGLFPRREQFRKFPGFMPYCRITLNLFERRPYRVRFARPADVPALLRLEDACWSVELRTSAAELARRIAVYPLGQWVLELDGEIVGVVYSQRVAAIDALRSAKWADIGSLHDPRGPLVQLLGLNVLPDKQQLGLGDQLLDLMLMRSALQGGVRGVVGLTRCKDFAGQSLEELAAYVAARDSAGLPLDPVLQFHHRHGANILGPVADYRPADKANLGTGILLHYDYSGPGTSLSVQGQSQLHVGAPSVESSLRALLGPKRQSAFARDRSLRDMGLDSLALLEFRTLLQQAFGQTLSPTFFFSHPTVAKIERYFAALEQAVETAPVPREPVLRLGAKEDSAPRAAASAPRPAEARAAIAVVGMAARLPGAADVAAYWQLLVEGRDAIVEVPRSRWDNKKEYSADPDAPGKIVTRYGGFVDRVDEFDAAFFDIAPPEARLMDPQQRLLLEVHWEALEDAGIDPRRLAETDCGFFVGMFSHDYETLIARAPDVEVGAYFATGNSASIAAGRLAYFFGTHGPALTIDTACSSSLVAVHQAMRSLRSGECDTALASGVSLMLSPRLSAAFSKAGMLAPDGRCKTFSADANGYVRSEGCAAVVLKRLDDAVRDGDRVLAVLRGSAINQDGASNGITAPNMTAQQRLLRRALDDAGVVAADIDYIEAHGTGTSLGDPVEFDALKGVFGADSQRRQALWLGSAKTNIGHAEAAAGLAGLIKVVLAMQHRTLPPHLHFTAPNQHIDLESLPARIPIVATEFRSHGRPLRAGISSFGFSGTNAHVVVEAAPSVPATAVSPRAAYVLPLSAKTDGALEALIGRYADWFAANPAVDLADACYTAAVGRAHHARRAAFVASTAAELTGGLRERLRARVVGAAAGSPRVAFVFTGQGSQYADMARELATSEPVFRAALAECQEGLADELERPLEEILFGGDSIDATELAQPALFAVEYALAKTFESWGVQPAAVMGHSVGEYVAACIAGVFSLRDALKLIAARGRLMGALPRDGAMIAVLGRVPDLGTVLAGAADVAVAAYNGPENVVLSGRRAAVEDIGRKLEQAGAKIVPLQVSHAFHSPLMTPILSTFKEIVRWAALTPPRLPLVSNVSGGFAGPEIAKPDYWARHIREPVRFVDGIRTLLDGGINVLLEIGPHPVLSQLGEACVGAEAAAVRFVPTLKRGVADAAALAHSVAALYECGVDIDWRAVHSSARGSKVALPSYAWQRKRYWFEEQTAANGAAARAPAVFTPRWVPTGLGEASAGRADSAAARPMRSARRLALITNEGAALAIELARLAAADGRECHRVVAADARQLRSQLAALAADGHALAVVDCRPFGIPAEVRDGTAEVEAALQLGMQTVELVRAAAAQGIATTWLVSSGARAVVDGEQPDAVAATLDGLANVVRTELPAIDFRSVDFDAGAAPAAVARALLDEIDAGAPDSRVSYRLGRRFTPSVVALAASEHQVRLRSDGAYLVVGGLGELGLHAATWLAERGARRLVLAGRTPLPPREEWASVAAGSPLAQKIAMVQALEALDVEVRVCGLDVGNADDVRALLERLAAEGWAPIRGLVHTAAAIADQRVDDVDAATYRRVLVPKVAGMRHLFAALQRESLDWALVYSSIGAVIGLPGQASYAAANAYVDAYAATLRARGWPVTTVDWCGWRDTGLARTQGGRRAIAELELLGIGTFDAAEGRGQLDTIVAAGVAQVIAMPLDAARGSFPAGLEPWLADAFERYGPPAAVQPRMAAAAVVTASPLAGLRGASLQSALEQMVAETVAGLLDSDVARIDPEASLGDLGMDSLLGIEFRRIMQRTIGIVLSATLVWNYPTVRAIAAHIAARLDAQASAATADGPNSQPILVNVGDMTDEEALLQLTGRK